ncbi:Gram-negative bacterial tonB protein [compost metagenome]
MKENRILNSETYKGEEPFGTWTYQSSRWTDTLNYNFPLVYSDKKCDSTFKNWLEDNDAIGYKAPKIMLAESLANYIGKTLRYPAKARENNIQGRVNLVFTITEEGKVENISIHQGANILLDKEAFRILRQLKFSTPPILKGRPQSLCQSMSISFRLD